MGHNLTLVMREIPNLIGSFKCRVRGGEEGVSNTMGRFLFSFLMGCGNGCHGFEGEV
jgi:hypothetical protein